MKHHLTIPKNRKFYALLGGNLVVLVLVGLFVLRPALGQLSKHATEITTVTADIQNAQVRTNDLRKLKETFPQYEAVYTPIIATFPRTRDVAGFQTELDELAKLASVQLSVVDTSGKPAGASSGGAAASAPTTQKAGETEKAEPATSAGKPAGSSTGGYPSIPVRLDVSGTYATVLDFISRLENMNRLTKITSIQLTGSNTGAVKASLDVQTLYLPEDKI